MLPRTPPVIFVDVGANKGYTACEFFELWLQHDVNASSWHSGIGKWARSTGTPLRGTCGNCYDCRRPRARKHSRAGGRAVLLELLPANQKLLAHLLAKMGLAADASVHNVAASNVSWSRLGFFFYESGFTLYKGFAATTLLICTKLCTK